LWDKNGPVNYKLGMGHVISQNLPDMFVITNGIYMAKREDMLKWSYFFGPKPKTMIIEKQYAIDIDDEIDLIEARALWKKYGYKF
jgi:N-acylneuraminate cytidylyltransferase